jgi:hypothetical protein
MGRANGGPSAASTTVATRRRTSPRGGLSDELTPASWQGSKTFEDVWNSALALMNAGTASRVVANMVDESPEESERRDAWVLAADVSRATLPILRAARVVTVPTEQASAAPQRFASNRDAIQFASHLQLPAPASFYDFRCPAGAAWTMAEPQPLRFDGALAWREGASLSVMPFWRPLHYDGSVKRSPKDSLGGGPVLRVVFGPRHDVMDRLGPGTVGGVAEDGELRSWDRMPDGGHQSRAAERALRCSLRFLDVLAALQ